MKKIRKRIFELNLPSNRSAFLWGPRKTGKTYWINRHLPDSVIIDLLKTDVFADYASRPWLKRAIIVSLEKQRRKFDSSIEVLPWKVFLETLWSGELGV